MKLLEQTAPGDKRATLKHKPVCLSEMSICRLLAQVLLLQGIKQPEDSRSRLGLDMKQDSDDFRGEMPHTLGSDDNRSDLLQSWLKFLALAQN